MTSLGLVMVPARHLVAALVVMFGLMQLVVHPRRPAAAVS